MDKPEERRGEAVEREEVTCLEEIVRIWQEEDVRGIEFVPILVPPYVLFAEKTLAISMKVLKPLYLFAYQKFFTEYKCYQEAKSQHSLSDTLTAAVFNTSLVILTIKADFPMGYNLHKEILLMQGQQVSYGREIQRLHALFSRHPKSPSAWQHIRWCYLQRHLLRIQQHQQSQYEETILLANEMESEREICRLSAEKYPKNYYAWMHRHWLLPQMNLVQLEDEIYFSHDWLYMHVSDHSAMQHFVQVINRVISIVLAALHSSQEQNKSITVINWLQEITQDITNRILQDKEKFLLSFDSQDNMVGLNSIITPEIHTNLMNDIEENKAIVLIVFMQKVLDWHVMLICKRCEAETLWLGWKMLIRMVQSCIQDNAESSERKLFGVVFEREKERSSYMKQNDSAIKEIFHSSKAQLLWTSFVSFLDRC